MDGLSEQTMQEFVEAVRRNEGLRNAIRARGLPVKETMKYLQDHESARFKVAHQEKVASNG